jgi:acetyltransferase-like isoleucine patch superfamily enzyme
MSIIGNGVKIKCRKFIAGEWLYLQSNVEVGRGGSTGPNSNVKIGKGVSIFEDTIINPSEHIEIGDNTGIGSEVMIWTHGAWLDTMKGFPSDFGPVKIGENVWLPARSIVLPNVSIGNNVVVGIDSIINRDLPSGCFAAGSPCKVIKRNYYPRILENKELNKMINNILKDWEALIDYKKIKNIDVDFDLLNKIITLKNNNGKNENNVTYFNLEKREMTGDSNDVSEDLRDYLRRRGIKFFTDRPFKSIKPQWMK